MAQIGYHCPHEQYPPGELLRLAKRAEAAGGFATYPPNWYEFRCKTSDFVAGQPSARAGVSGSPD